MTTEHKELLPIGTRVTHFDGAVGTHGVGTIVAYNGVEPSSYLKSDFKNAVKLAGEAGLAEALISSLYDGQRCPYVVRFDPCTGEDEHSKQKLANYPQGYKDVYETDSVQELKPSENIFPANKYILIMVRTWMEKTNAWTVWSEMSPDLYERCKNLAGMEFCIRPPQ